MILDGPHLFWVNSFTIFFSTKIINLYSASRLGHIEIVRDLLDKDANIEAKDNYGKTPLIHG